MAGLLFAGSLAAGLRTAGPAAQAATTTTAQPGVALQILSCHGYASNGANQRWYFFSAGTYVGQQVYQIENSNSHLCVDPNLWSPYYSSVSRPDCRAAPDQYWEISSPNENDHVNLINAWTSWCLATYERLRKQPHPGHPQPLRPGSRLGPEPVHNLAVRLAPAVSWPPAQSLAPGARAFARYRRDHPDRAVGPQEEVPVTVSSSGIDAVLQAPPPAFSAAEAAEIGLAAFGIVASGAQSLGSERDQAFLLTGPSGAGVAVLKVSNPAEDPAMIDMEAAAVFHVAACDPGLTVAIPRLLAAAGDEAPPSGGLSARRARWEHGGAAYWVRAYDLLPGRARLDTVTLADHALTAWGETTARLGRALRGFIHPRAVRRLPWDVQHAASARPMSSAIGDQAARAAVTAVLDRFDAAVAPRWGLLRAQVIHGDLTADNVLADDSGLITGIVDFGDMTHTALAADLASVLDSLGTGRGGEEMFRTARLVIDGYERITPLEPLEFELIGELWAARAAVTMAIGSWRAAAGLEEPEFAERFGDSALAMIDTLLTTGWERTARLLGADQYRAPASRGGPGRLPGLAARRDAVFGPAMEPLSYAEPIEMASASGVWMTGTDGRRYLDMYNNVVCVGHAHPRVTSAVARQWRVLNTNLRYLHASAIELAERLAATCPDGLDTVLFVNSGSEANDVAWRLARHHTGNAGGLCTDFAYHGVTAATADLSPEVLPGALPPPHVETWAPPDTYRGLRAGTDGFAAALGPAGRPRPRPGGGDPGRGPAERRGLRPGSRLCPGTGAADPRGGRAVDRRRGAGRPRADRRGDVVVRAVRDRA